MGDLDELLRAFHAIVVGGAPLAQAEALVAGGRVSSEERMGVYVYAYGERLRAALAEDFPKLAQVVGREPFAALCRAYLRACPPHHWSLREVGDRLADYLGEESSFPLWWADLARLERARREAFDGGDGRTLSRDDLGTLDESLLARTRFSLVPSARLVTLHSNADDVWSAVEDAQPWTEPRAEARRVVAWRRDLTVIHRTLEADEGGFLAVMVQGATLAEAGVALADTADPAQRTLEVMLAAVDGALISAITSRTAG
jgi:hypothetical protein